MLDNTHLRMLLQGHFAPFVAWRPQRLDCLTTLLVALVQLSTVNLAKLALAFETQAPSSYRRLQRFFAQIRLPQQAVAGFVLHLVPASDRLVISVDRTEWHFGKTPINILMASLVYGETAFPLVWITLGKPGMSSGAEQRALLRKLFLVVAPERIDVVLADREFIGRPFMGYLGQHEVGFAVRIRKDAHVWFRGQSRRAEHLFRDLAVGAARRLRQRRTIYGQRVWLYALRLRDGPKGERRLLLVAGTVRRLLARYRQRWGIEVLFAGLKSRGFDFETTHLRHRERISTLVGVLALGYSLAHATGRYLSRQVSRSRLGLKRHGRRARSLFRLGLDHLRQVLLLGMGSRWRTLMALFLRGRIGPALAPT